LLVCTYYVFLYNGPALLLALIFIFIVIVLSSFKGDSRPIENSIIKHRSCEEHAGMSVCYQW